MNWLEKRPFLAVALLMLGALVLRTVQQFDHVFQGAFVNFQETDAWYHVRIVENLVHHFPWRVAVDPYMGLAHPPPGVATGPFYDWLLGAVVWLAGLGHPSTELIHTIAAWFPAVLGALIVPVVFLLGQRFCNPRAGLIAAAVIATLPGHFLSVSSLGFTDHHVMESLLSALFLLALLRAFDQPISFGRAVVAGCVLAAYVLTFVGGAFFIAIVVAWAAYDRIRSRGSFPILPFSVCFLTAAALVAPSYRTLWMPYSIAVLLGGVLLVFVLDQWRAWCGARRKLYWSGLFLGAFSGVLLSFRLPALGVVAPFFLPAYFGTTGAVSELQALVVAQGAFTLLPAWSQFAGAYILAVVGLLLLGEAAVKRPTTGATLLFFWGFVTFLLAMGQVRMTYYFAVAAALLSGYLVARISESETRAVVHWAGATALVALVFVPNVATGLAMGRQSQGVPYDWRQALDWLRESTPEPFGDAAFYYAQYPREFVDPAQAYSIMAWWDYGYWLEAIARRVPVSNPTQANASLAARFYLAQSEANAVEILEQTRSRYVVVNSALPLLVDAQGRVSGNFPDFFVWDRTQNLDDYFLIALDGARFRLFYRPAYYRTMAARLFLSGVNGVATPESSAVAFVERPPGKGYAVLTSLRKFTSTADALRAEQDCRGSGCLLVGDDPHSSCVALEPLRHLRPVFQSDTPVLGAGSQRRAMVQIYERF